MCKHRRLRAERLKQKHVFRGVRDVVVSSNHMRNLHLHVVYDDREMVGWGPSERSSTKSSMLAESNSIGPWTASTNAVRVAGTLKRIARGAPAASSAATRSAVSARQVRSHCHAALVFRFLAFQPQALG